MYYRRSVVRGCFILISLWTLFVYKVIYFVMHKVARREARLIVASTIKGISAKPEACLSHVHAPAQFSRRAVSPRGNSIGRSAIGKWL
jgi:hypothetical protein